ncbi:TFIIH C1-like domain containing protein [Trema orientale]|uniref:TFIIH C1-like domain containing protein n=1 Tax=Trema orientale TaxID=63057 RepID=A0A2P5BU79_TREOI|nr:TFIIH C1-like domain containing protein [Trema orientale]
MSEKDHSGSEAGKQPGYILRENPKKTRRFADASGGALLKELKVCKECGKGFQSLKALCGHMASHSDKERFVINKYEQHSGTSEKQKLVMDSQSDTETSAPRQRRLSRRIRYKNLDVYSSMGNGSSSVSGIEQEQQEVAISLMLLSRDSGHKGGLNSVGESSDNNSVVLEAKSSSIDMIISGKKVLSSVTNLNETLEAKKARDGELNFPKNVSVSDNSDSGYFRNGPKKIESDVSVDGFVRNGDFKKLEVESGSGFGKNLLDEEGKDQVERGSSKYELRKRTRNGLYRPESLMGSYKNEANCSPSGGIYRNGQKRSKYECLTCKKTFHSHRALGGHRANHTKNNGCCESICESGENSIETDHSPIPVANDRLIENGTGKSPIKEDFAERKPVSKKSKGHECPICFRIFKSGQALGGHKRSHFVGGREANTMVIRQVPPEAEITVLFDLNLPAPTEEDANGDVGFVAW